MLRRFYPRESQIAQITLALLRQQLLELLD